MGKLITEPNIPDPDGFYEELVGLHEGLTEAQSAAVNARLVLILANQVGDREVLSEAMEAARKAAENGIDRQEG